VKPARAIDGPIAVLAGANARLSRAFVWLAGLILMVMLAVVLLQVLFRYGLNNSLAWTEELSKTMMVWTAFLVAPWAYRNGSNVAIEMLVEAVDRRLRLALRIGINLLVLWILVVFLDAGFGFVARGFAIQAASIGVDMAWFYMIVPTGFAALALVGIELLLRDAAALITGDDGYRLAPVAVPKEGE